MHDQKFLNEYFSKHWKPSTTAYRNSSYEAIASKIKDDEWLLDAGCGFNPFKKLVKNVVGVDPAMDEADFKMPIEDFTSDKKFDVATCLGSINFGDESVIDRQISKVVSCLKEQSRIYWRLNPGRKDHEDPLCNQVDFFPWTLDKLREFAVKHGYTQTDGEEETDGKVIRLYAEWHR
jgi:hypothetical protein